MGPGEESNTCNTILCLNELLSSNTSTFNTGQDNSRLGIGCIRAAPGQKIGQQLGKCQPVPGKH